MERHSINLIIRKEDEKLLLRRLRIILPILAAVTLLAFVIAWVGSIAYINSNVAQFNHLKAQIKQLERKITSRKSTEGIYTLTIKRLEVLDKLISQVKKYEKPLSEINKFQKSKVSIGEIIIGASSDLSFSVSASSSSILNDFISYLLTDEENETFSNIQAQNIFRDKTGKYNLTILVRPNPSLYK